MIANKFRQAGLRLSHMTWMLVAWVLLWGQLSIANVLTGVLVAYIISAYLPLPMVPVQGGFNLAVVLKLFIVFFVLLIKSSFQVTLLAYSRAAAPKGKIVKITYEINSEMILALYTDYVNLIPGTLIAGISRTKKTLTVHVLDSSNPEKFAATLIELYKIQNLFIKAFEKKSPQTTASLNVNKEKISEISQNLGANL